MCGVFGVLLPNRSIKPDESRLRKSCELLAHRGPDANSTLVLNGAGFAHTRLSFVDIDARSNQPFRDRTGRYTLVFNGEIYNFREIRDDLAGKGVEFQTTSDTEVLLKALIHGDTRNVLRRLEGMFAFGFYDADTGTLVLARDRFGMKPLNYYEDNGKFFFFSEVKALLPWCNLGVDRLSLSAYLMKFRGATKGFTLFDGVKSLAPGQFLKIRHGEEARFDTFAHMEDFLDASLAEELNGKSPSAIVDYLSEKLTQSVANHMFADVPVGAFCSGGVDSSLLMAIAKQQYSNLAIFHANIVGPWSELNAARSLAHQLDLDMQHVDVREEDFRDRIPEVIWHFEGPVADRPNCVPLMLVARLARKNNVKGLLSGEGSDECFLGYPWLGRRKLIENYYGMGDALRKLIHKIPEIGAIMWPKRDETADLVRSLLNRREIADDELRTRHALDAVSSSVLGQKTGWTLDYLQYHLRILLHRNDTMGMAASIEARFPFLDMGVVKKAVNLPDRFKLRYSISALDKAHPFIRDKWVIRKIADRYVKKNLSQRPKFGFWTTVFQRLDISPEIFKDSYIGDTLGLTYDQMSSTLEESDQDLRMRLLHLDIWGRRFFRNENCDALVANLSDNTTIRPLRKAA